MDGVVSLSRTYGLDVFGWYASPYLSSRNLGILQHQGTSGNDRALADLTAIEQRRTHADEGVVVDGAGMDGDIMADGDIRADMRRTRLEGDMHARAILYIGAMANSDGGYIATNNGIEPDGALVAHLYVANNGGVLTEITVFAPLGCQTLVTLNQCHIDLLLDHLLLDHLLLDHLLFYNWTIYNWTIYYLQLYGGEDFLSSA